MHYKQCLMGVGTKRTIGWIPAAFAKVGKHVDIDGENFLVMEVYRGRLPEWQINMYRELDNEVGSLRAFRRQLYMREHRHYFA